MRRVAAALAGLAIAGAAPAWHSSTNCTSAAARHVCSARSSLAPLELFVAPSNDALCMLGENLDAYKDESNPVGTGEHGIYMPAAELSSVLQWALLNRASATNGFYDLDLWLVPLTGDDFGDYASRP